MSESRSVIQNIAHGREMDVKKHFFLTQRISDCGVLVY
jgi:hypothetical protein